MALKDLNIPKIKEYVKTSIERRHSSDPSKVHKTELSLVDYLKNTFAEGFSKNLQLGETKFVGINENTYTYPEQFQTKFTQLGLTDFFHNKDAKGFTKKQVSPQFTGIVENNYNYPNSQGLNLGILGIQNIIPDTDAVGFTKNMIFRESKFVGIENNTYTYPDTLGLGLGNLDFADYMDGVPQGRGFIPPGGHPKGFTPNMTDTMFMSDGHSVSLDNMNVTISNYTLSNDSWVPNTLSIPIQDARRFYPANAGTWSLNANRRYPSAIHLGPTQHMGLSLIDSAIVDRYVEHIGEEFTNYEDLMRDRKKGPINTEWASTVTGQAVLQRLEGVRLITDLGLIFEAAKDFLKDPSKLLSTQTTMQLAQPDPNTKIFNPFSTVLGGRTSYFKMPRHINVSTIRHSAVDTLNELMGKSTSRYGVYERFEGYDWNREDYMPGDFNTDSTAGLFGLDATGKKGRRNEGNKLYQWSIARFVDESGIATPIPPPDPDPKLSIAEAKKSFGQLVTGKIKDAATGILKTQVIDKLEDFRDDTLMALTGERHGVPSPPKQYVKSQRKLSPSGEKVNVGENKGGGKSRYATLDYSKLGKDEYRYEKLTAGTLRSGGVSQNLADAQVPENADQRLYLSNEGNMPDNVVRIVNEGSDRSITKSGEGSVHTVGKRTIGQIGNQGTPDGASELAGPLKTIDYGIGLTSTHKSNRVDKINLQPISEENPEKYTDPSSNKMLKDLIKFRFKDVVNGKYLVFRAILSGINDNISPEWNSEKYIGRADKVHVYSGAERNISFNFAIAPKSKVELPRLMEKLNYLMGLCYPMYDVNNNNRMVAPFVQLTIGDILKDSPGFLNSLSYTVEESSPWEIQDGLQFPKFINVSCDFKYIGKDLPAKEGKILHLDMKTVGGGKYAEAING